MGSVKPRVNFVWSTDTIGGSERRMVEIMPELIKRGFDVTSFVVSAPGSQLERELRSAGCSVVVARSIPHMTLEVSRCRAVLTWTFGLKAGLPVRLLRLASPNWRGGQLWSAQNGLDAERSGLLARVDRWSSSAIDYVVANSTAARDHAVAQVGIRPEKVRVIPSALPPGWAEQPVRQAKEHVVIAMIGNSRPEKQHVAGLAAFLAMDDSDCRLEVYTNSLASLKHALDAVTPEELQRIAIHTGVEVTPDVMRDIDILLHPSSSESLPRVVLEARSQGVWVVGFDVGEVARYANALVELNDSEKLAEALEAAVQSVRAGDYPPEVAVPTIGQYVDQVLATLGKYPPKEDGTVAE